MLEEAINNFYQSLGLNIKKAREEKMGLTQEKLAKSIGMSRTSIVNIEQGRHHIQIHTLIDISNKLNTDISELIPDLNGELVLDSQVNKPLDSKEKESVQKNLSMIENKVVDINVTKNKKHSRSDS